MTDAPSALSRGFKWLLAFAAGFCLLMVALSIRAIVSGLRTPEAVSEATPAVEAPPPEAKAGMASPAAPAFSEEPASESRPADHAPDLETVRDMEQNASDLYDHLRRQSRENPEADDSLSEQEIKELEKAGAIAI